MDPTLSLSLFSMSRCWLRTSSGVRPFWCSFDCESATRRFPYCKRGRRMSVGQRCPTRSSSCAKPDFGMLLYAFLRNLSTFLLCARPLGELDGSEFRITVFLSAGFPGADLVNNPQRNRFVQTLCSSFNSGNSDATVLNHLESLTVVEQCLAVENRARTSKKANNSRLSFNKGSFSTIRMLLLSRSSLGCTRNQTSLRILPSRHQEPIRISLEPRILLDKHGIRI